MAERRTLTTDYLPERIGVRTPYIPAENRIITAMIEAALESGLQHSDALNLAIGVYKELDILARNERGDILDRSALKVIRIYCRAILRSGSTFSAFEIATRAVACWRETRIRLRELHAEWDRQTVTARLRLRKIRQEAAMKAGLANAYATLEQDEADGVLEPVIEAKTYREQNEQLEAVGLAAELPDDWLEQEDHSSADMELLSGEQALELLRVDGRRVRTSIRQGGTGPGGGSGNVGK